MPQRRAGQASARRQLDHASGVPVVGKRTEVSEEIRIHKQPVIEERQVSETLRRERVNIEGADVYGETPLEQACDEELHGETLP